MADTEGTPPGFQEIDERRRRGRGAAVNPPSRYDSQVAEATDDGWAREPDDPLRTEVRLDNARSIIARNRSPDVPFDRSINPYRGCEHGCTYCFARPSHAQLGLSPGLDFETQLVAKPNAAALLEKALSRPSYKPAPIAMGTNTDPYQPIEREYRIMRSILCVLRDFRHPFTITTKGALVTRDLDILGEMGRAGLARVTLSLTTMDHRVSRAMEPRAASPSRRIDAIRALTTAGVPTSINVAPIVPGLTDHEIETLIDAGVAAGADHVGYTLLRLPLEVAPLFREWLTRAYPDRAKRIMGRVRELHGGKDYDATWYKRLRGEGVHAQLTSKRFALARARHGLARKPPELRTDLFRVPPRSGDQLSLGL